MGRWINAALGAALGLGLGAALVGATSGEARACGMMIFTEHAARSGGMNRQEIFVNFGEATTTMIVSAAFVDESGDLAFVLPLIAPPATVVDGDVSLFLALERGTAPRVTIDDASDEGGGCSPIKAGGDLGGGESEVTVFGRGMTETYTYLIVGGDTGIAITEWLASAGLDVPPEVSGALQPYIDQGWVFLAAEVRPDAPSGDLAPLEISLPAATPDSFKIPFGIAAASLPPDQPLEVALYVASDAMVLPGNYEGAEIDPDAVEAISPESSNFAALFAEASAGGKMVLEYSSDGWEPTYLGSWYAGDELEGPASGGDPAWLDDFAIRVGGGPRRLSRFRGVLGADELKDMTFTMTTPHDVSSSYAVTYKEGGCRIGGGGWPALLLVMAAPLIARRRRRRP